MAYANQEALLKQMVAAPSRRWVVQGCTHQW